MGQAKTIKAYPIVRELMNRALEAPTGVRIKGTYKECFMWRMQFYTIRKRWTEQAVAEQSNPFAQGLYHRLESAIRPEFPEDVDKRQGPWYFEIIKGEAAIPDGTQLEVF